MATTQLSLMLVLACASGCASFSSNGPPLQYTRVNDEEIHAYIPASGGAARTEYLEAHRECASIVTMYRVQSQHVRDSTRGWMVGLGVAAVALGTLTGVSAAAASAESTQRELLYESGQANPGALRASVERETTLDWVSGVSGGLSGALDVATVMVWLSDSRGDSFAEAASNARDAVNESDRTITDAEDLSPAQLSREAAILRRRCRTSTALLPPLGGYLGDVSPSATAATTSTAH